MTSAWGGSESRRRMNAEVVGNRSLAAHNIFSRLLLAAYISLLPRPSLPSPPPSAPSRSLSSPLHAPLPQTQPFPPQCQALSRTPPAYGNSTSFGPKALSVVYGTPKAERSTSGSVSVPVRALAFLLLTLASTCSSSSSRCPSTDNATPGTEVCHPHLRFRLPVCTDSKLASQQSLLALRHSSMTYRDARPFAQHASRPVNCSDSSFL